MNRKTKKVALQSTSLLMLFIAIFMVTYVGKETLREESLLKSELHNFITPSVTLHGVSYNIQNGDVTRKGQKVSIFESVRVLRIAHASVLSRLDPLFGIEETNPLSFKEVIRLLETQKNEIVSLHNKKDRTMLKKAFYPTTFLFFLADAEEKRQEAIVTPSQKGILSYYKTLDAVFKEYKDYLADTKTVYKQFSAGTYIFLAGKSSQEKYLSAFSQMEDAAFQRSAELRTRKQCLRKFSVKCPSLSRAFLKLNHIEAVPSIAHIEIPSYIFGHKMILDKYRAVPYPKPPTQEIIVETSPSICEGNIHDSPVYYNVKWEQDDIAKSKGRLSFAFLNDLYFFDLAQSSGDVFLEKLKEKGARYSYRTIENFYICPDIGVRYAELGTIAALRDSLQSAPLARNMLGKAAEELEMRIARADIVRKADVDAYMVILSDFLVTNGENGATKLLGKEWVMRSESLLSMFRAQSGYFDAFAQFVHLKNQIIKELVDVGLPYSTPALFKIRNFPLWFLLAYNKNVIEQTPQLLESIPWNDGVFTLLSAKNDFREKYTDEEVLAFLIEGIRTERKMLREAAIK